MSAVGLPLGRPHAVRRLRVRIAARLAARRAAEEERIERMTAALLAEWADAGRNVRGVSSPRAYHLGGAR